MGESAWIDFMNPSDQFASSFMMNPPMPETVLPLRKASSTLSLYHRLGDVCQLILMWILLEVLFSLSVKGLYSRACFTTKEADKGWDVLLMLFLFLFNQRFHIMNGKRSFELIMLGIVVKLKPWGLRFLRERNQWLLWLMLVLSGGWPRIGFQNLLAILHSRKIW